MQEYNIEIHDNCVITKINNKRIFLDTGSPSSFGNCSELKILGKSYKLSDNFMEFSVEGVGKAIGTEIDILLGMDVLKDLNFFISLDREIIRFSLEPIKLEGINISVDFFMNIPKININININNSNINAFFDTGAKILYFPSSFTENYKKIGSIKDFHPMIGEFKTDTYEIPVIFVDKKINMITGNLPSLFEEMLFEAEGIIGNDIFKYFDICFNFKNNSLILVYK